MIPQLCDQNLIADPSVDNSVFGSNPSGPEPGQSMLQRLRFPDPGIWGPGNLFDQKINSRDNRGVRLLPV